MPKLDKRLAALEREEQALERKRKAFDDAQRMAHTKSEEAALAVANVILRRALLSKNALAMQILELLALMAFKTERRVLVEWQPSLQALPPSSDDKHAKVVKEASDKSLPAKPKNDRGGGDAATPAGGAAPTGTDGAADAGAVAPRSSATPESDAGTLNDRDTSLAENKTRVEGAIDSASKDALLPNHPDDDVANRATGKEKKPSTRRHSEPAASPDAGLFSGADPIRTPVLNGRPDDVDGQSSSR